MSKLTATDLKNIDNIVIDGVDRRDHPDYVDIFCESADLNGVPMTDEQLDDLNDNHWENIYDYFMGEGFIHNDHNVPTPEKAI